MKVCCEVEDIEYGRDIIFAMGDIFCTGEGIQYNGGILLVRWRDIISMMKGYYKYYGEILSKIEGYSVLFRDIISTLAGYVQYVAEYSVQWNILHQLY